MLQVLQERWDPTFSSAFARRNKMQCSFLAQPSPSAKDRFLVLRARSQGRS
jgi:hypothetical protein